MRRPKYVNDRTEHATQIGQFIERRPFPKAAEGRQTAGTGLRKAAPRGADGVVSATDHGATLQK